MKRRGAWWVFPLVVIAALAASSWAPGAGTGAPATAMAPAQPPGGYATDRVIVKLTPDAALAVMGREGKAIPPGLQAALTGAKVKGAAPAFADLWKGTGKPLKAAEKARRVKLEFPRRAARVPVQPVPDLENVLVLTLEPGVSAERALSALRSDPAEVVYAQPDRCFAANRVPDDPYFSSSGTWGQPYPDLWGLHQIKAPGAWEVSTGSDAVVVAVVDTGADTAHPELAGRLWTNPGEIPGNGVDDDGNGFVDDVTGWDFVCRGREMVDGFGHATHVSGTIGAATDNGVGLAGLSWSGKVMPVKGLCDAGFGWSSDLAAAMRYAADNGADIMNNSWGGYGRDDFLQEAVNYCYALGCIVVASAGNDAFDPKYFSPAGLDNVVCVAASTPYDTLASFSNYGPKVDISAPGEDVLSLSAANSVLASWLPDNLVGPDGLYLRLSGTSMAAPHVCGSLALVLAAHPDWPAAKVISQVMGTADDIDALNPGLEGMLGMGRVNLEQALTATSLRQRVQLLGQAADDGLRGGNGVIEPGDRVRLWFRLKFEAESPAVTLSLATSDRYVRLLRGTVGLGAIAGWGEVSTDLLPFALYISPSCPKPHRIALTLTVTAGAYEQSFPIELPVAPQLPGWPVWWSGNPVQALLTDVDRDRRHEVVLGGWDGTYLLNENAANQPGWPASVGGPTPCVGDIDGDGGDEIVTAGYYQRQLWALRTNGDVVAHFPVSLISTWVDNLTLADLDGQPGLEVIVLGEDYSYYPSVTVIEVFRGDGTALPGWPVLSQFYTPSSEQGRTAVGDVDGDGTPEVVALEARYWAPDPAANRVWAWRADGTLLPGFPREIPSGYETSSVSGPVLGDLNGDGRMEIICSANRQVFVLRGDGSGWWRQCGGGPLSLGDIDEDGRPEVISGGPWCESAFDSDGTVLWWGRTALGSPEGTYEPTVGDVDSDGRPDIVQRDQSNLYAFHADGQLIDGYPIQVGAGADSWWWGSEGAVALGDVNGDGRIDLVTGGSWGYDVYAFTTSGHYRPRSMEWPMRGGNPRNDGRYTPPK